MQCFILSDCNTPETGSGHHLAAARVNIRTVSEQRLDPTGKLTMPDDVYTPVSNELNQIIVPYTVEIYCLILIIILII